MPLQIQNRQRHVAIQTKAIKKRVSHMMTYLGCADQELSIVFGNDRLLHTLNRLYRCKDRPTNVLAFPQEQISVGHVKHALLGDIVVSIPIALQEALELDQSLEERVVYLILHGLLHLLGYDHGSLAQHRRMGALEKQVLQQCPA